MLATVEKTQNTVVVDVDDAPFIGVSGRQVASIERGTELTVLGEHGTYTIVRWGARNGYVPADQLVSLDEFNADPADVEEAVASAPTRRSGFSLNPFRIFSPRLQRAA